MKLLILLLIICTLSVSAKETQQKSSVIGTSNNPYNLLFVLPESIPYHYRDQNTGEVVGTEVDILNRLIKNAGLGDAEFSIYSWKRALQMADNRPATLIMPLSRTVERENTYHWLRVLRETWFSIFSLNSTPINPEIIKNTETKIYCENGGIQCDMLVNIGVPEQLIERSEGISHDRIVDLAIAGRIKYFIAEQDLVQVGLKERGLEQSTLKIAYTINQPVQDYLAISRDNDPNLVALLKDALTKDD